MNKKYLGKTRLETMLVMLLLIIFGVATYTLVLVTATSYEKTQSESMAKDNLRLASSYLESKLRQADKDKVSVVKDMFEGKEAIVIEEEYEAMTYQTVIYHQDGTIRELYIKKDTKLEDTSGVEIAKIDKFDVEYLKKGTIQMNFEKSANQENYKMQTIVKLN